MRRLSFFTSSLQTVLNSSTSGAEYTFLSIAQASLKVTSGLVVKRMLESSISSTSQTMYSSVLLSIVKLSMIVGTTAGGKDFRYVFDSKDFRIECFNNAHILHQKVAVRVVFQPCMSVGIAEWFAGWTADNNIGSLYRIVQWKAFCRERFMNISVYDVHTDVLPVGLAGTGIVVNGI